MIKLISTGIEGAERAALDAAETLKYPWGGSAPSGRSGHYDPIPESYFTPTEFGALVEAPSSRPMQARAMNTQVADATLILRRDGAIIPPVSKQIIIHLRHRRGRYELADPTKSYHVIQVVKWIVKNDIQTLNVSSSPKRMDDPFTSRTFVFMKDILSFTAIYFNTGAKIWT
jgi:hypothetical protein